MDVTDDVVRDFGIVSVGGEIACLDHVHPHLMSVGRILTFQDVYVMEHVPRKSGLPRRSLAVGGMSAYAPFGDSGGTDFALHCAASEVKSGGGKTRGLIRF